MKELKTLKDIDIHLLNDEQIKAKLKAEAVKHLKFLEAKDPEYYVVDWIIRFFNLTKEDLR